MNATVVSAFGALTVTGATQPLITYYDDATGERTELSGATLGNWVSKSANLLRDGLGLGTGDVAGLALPPHWQTAAILLASWSAGLAVDLARAECEGTALAVGFVTLDTLGTFAADEVYALALAPLGLPFRPGPPAGTLDYVLEARGYGDHFASAAIDPRSVALADGTSHAELAQRARPVPAGGRVLVDAAATPDPVDWLVSPLLAGASIVLCRNLDPAKLAARLTSEQAAPL